MEGELASESQLFSQPDVLLGDHHSVDHITRSRGRFINQMILVELARTVVVRGTELAA